MDLKRLKNVLVDEPSYRAKQAQEMIFQKLILDWEEATNLPQNLREAFKKELPLEIKGEIFVNKKGEAIKALITLQDGLKVEAVLLRHKDGRNTVCVSSQIGCALGCLFCQTGKLGFKRNLEANEILDQVLFFARFLKKEMQKISNIVFMGMGEPFLNYENVMEAIRFLNHKDGFNLGSRRISISTVGIPVGILKLAKENLQVNLAVSLHATNNNLRNKIIPINQKYPLEELFKAVDEYIKIARRRVMFEYLVLDKFNDQEKDALELARLTRKPLYFVNLVRYNPGGEFKSASGERIKYFKRILQKKAVIVTERYSFGREIDAACGQLVYKS